MSAALTAEARERVLARLRDYRLPDPCRHAVHPAHVTRLLPPERADEAVAVVPCGYLCGHSFLLGPAPDDGVPRAPEPLPCPDHAP